MKRLLNLCLCAFICLCLIGCHTSNDVNNKTYLNPEEIADIDPSVDKYIYHDRKAISISYDIKFDYEITDETLKLHEEFIEKSGLKDLNYRDITYYKSYIYIHVTFAPENDTIEVQNFMNQLKEEYDIIISIDKEVDYYYDVVFTHNPSYYKLKAEQKVYFELNETQFLPKGIYKSEKDLQKAIDDYYELCSNYSQEKGDSSTMDIAEAKIETIKSIYDKEYFKNNVLVVTDVIETRSWSTTIEVDSIYIKDNTVYIFLKMSYLYAVNAIGKTKFGITINKEHIKNIKTLKHTLLYNHPEYDYYLC